MENWMSLIFQPLEMQLLRIQINLISDILRINCADFGYKE